jgi:hypothetical protein
MTSAPGPPPAWYALSGGGWRDYVTLLHPPYTAWHLAYVVAGGCLAPAVAWGRLGLTVLAFFLAMGVGARALDELRGRPLRTAIPSGVLVALAAGSIAAACAIGVAVAVTFDPLLLAFVAAGVFLVLAYNLELFGGFFHTDVWFGLAWGAFPVLTGYAACAGSVSATALLAAAWAATLSLAQRRLSAPVRRLRRDVCDVRGELELSDGTRTPLGREDLTAAPEAALRLLTAATVLAAAALAAFRI